MHRGDITRFFPTYAPGPPGTRSAYLVQHGDETAGVMVVSDEGEGTAQVELDYVTPRFRDFSPGEFVFRRSGLFRDQGFRQVLTPPGMVAPVLRPPRLHPAPADRYRLDLPERPRRLAPRDIVNRWRPRQRYSTDA